MINKQKLKFWASIIVLALAASYIVFFVATKTELFKGIADIGDGGGGLPGACPEGNLKIENIDLQVHASWLTISGSIKNCSSEEQSFNTFIDANIDYTRDGNIDMTLAKDFIQSIRANSSETVSFVSMYVPEKGEFELTMCIRDFPSTCKHKIFDVPNNPDEPQITSVDISPNQPEVGDIITYSSTIRNPTGNDASIGIHLGILENNAASINYDPNDQTISVAPNSQSTIEWQETMLHAENQSAIFNINSGSSNSYTKRINFTVEEDSTDPAVSISAPAENSVVKGNVPMSAAAADAVGVNEVQFKLDGVDLGAEDTTSPYSIDWNTTTASNGAHTLTARARDAAGNTQTSAAVNVTVDNAAPNLQVITPIATPTNVTTPQFIFSSNESGTIAYGGSCRSTTTAAVLAPNVIIFNTLAEGTYSNCTVAITDSAGNVSATLPIGSFTIDTTAPTVTTWAAATNPTVKTSNIPVNLVFSEAISGLATGDFTISGGTVASVSNAEGTSFTVNVTPSSTTTQTNITVNLNTNTVNDAAGNANAVATSSVTINFYPKPNSITGTSPSNNTTPNITVGNGASGLTANIYSDSTCATSKGSAAMTTTTKAVTSNAISSNTTYYAKFTDAGTNSSVCSTINFAYVLDTDAPVLTVKTAIPTYTKDNTPDYTFSTTEAGNITYGGFCSSTAKTTAVAGDNIVTFNSLNDGTYTNCTIKVTDTVGNNSNLLTLTNFTVDTTSPANTSISINNGSSHTNTRNVTLTLSAVDAGSGMGTGAQMQFSNDNSTWFAAEAYATQKNWELTAGDGSKTVYVKFKDAAGNWSAAVNDTITLDTTAPEGITITYPNNGAAVGGNVNITAEGDSELVKIEFRIDGTKRYEDTDGSDGYSYSWDTKTILGTRITVVGYDAAGIPTFAEINVTVDNTAPEISALAADPTDYTATITWETSEPSDTFVVYRKSASEQWTTTDLADADPLVTAHTVELAGLTQGTEYEIRAISQDSVKNFTKSSLTFITESQNPVGFWKLNETSGDTAADFTENANNGTKYGGAWRTEEIRPGVLLDGINDYVSIAQDTDNPALFSSQATRGEITVAAWVKVKSLNTDSNAQGRQPVVSKGKSREWEWALYVHDDGKIGFSTWQCGGSGHSEPSGGSLPIDEWHHVAATYQKGVATTVYLDGEEVDTGMRNVGGTEVVSKTYFAGEPCLGTDPVRIGSRSDGQFLNALISDVRIFNRALSQQEISALTPKVSITQPPFGVSVTGSVDVRIETDSAATDVELYVGGAKYADAVMQSEADGKKIFSVAWDTVERGLAGQTVNREIFARALYDGGTAPLDSTPLTVAVTMPREGRSNIVSITPLSNTTALTGIIPIEIIANTEAEKVELIINGEAHQITAGLATASGKKFTYQWDTSEVSGFGVVENIQLSAKAYDAANVSWDSVSPLTVSVQRPAQVVTQPIKKVTVAAGSGDIQDLTLSPGSNAFIVPITVAVASSIPNDTETKITGFTLNYTGDFPHSKITEPAVFLGTEPVDDATVTKATQNGNITVKFAGDGTLLTSPKRFLLYVKANVADADAGKFIQYKVSPITVTPAERPIVYAKTLGEQLTVAETLVAALTCPAPKVKSGAACACPTGTYDYTGETFYAGLACIPCTVQELRENGGFICPQHFRQAAASSGSSASGASTSGAVTSGGTSSGGASSTAAATAGLSPEDRQLLSFFQTCQLQKKFTYTGPSKPGTSRVNGMCIECPTEIYEAYSGSCTAPVTAVAAAEPQKAKKPPAKTSPTRTPRENGGAAGAPRQAAGGDATSGAQQTGAAATGAATGSATGSTAGASQTGAASLSGTGARSVAGTPGLRGSTRLKSAPERGQEGPAAALYLAVLPAAWMLRRLRTK